MIVANITLLSSTSAIFTYLIGLLMAQHSFNVAKLTTVLLSIATFSMIALLMFMVLDMNVSLFIFFIGGGGFEFWC